MNNQQPETKVSVLEEDQIKHNISDEAVLKIEKAIAKLADKTTNPQALTLAHNLKMSKDVVEKRKWIVMYYMNCFQLLSFIQMGQRNSMTMEDYEIELKKMFKEF